MLMAQCAELSPGPGAPAAPTIPADSWVETGAPELTMEVVSQMVYIVPQQLRFGNIENRPSLRCQVSWVKGS